MVSGSAKSELPDSSRTNRPSSGGEVFHERVNVPSWLSWEDEDSTGGSITLIEASIKLPRAGSWTSLMAEAGGDFGSQSASAGGVGGGGSQSRKCHHSGRAGGGEIWAGSSGSL